MCCVVAIPNHYAQASSVHQSARFAIWCNQYQNCAVIGASWDHNSVNDHDHFDCEWCV